ncbi:DUF3128 domain containing protein [Nitzschia inconspicua]|uniref:DUF3128 domain containing protein n=1 Tax=Nitzschia inconspicua TaxID=303405 RepID=A0A9K3M4T0_9STRA|nr:DUF3128 domain containing protein [Nitzschia inconspicua]
MAQAKADGRSLASSSSPSSSATINSSSEQQLMDSIQNDNNDNNIGFTQESPPHIQLGLFWDEWARCIGSRYQADHLYRVGRLDSCANQWRDLKTATRARLLVMRDPQAARELLESTYYKKRTTFSPTAGAIWELKDKPGWS